MSHRNKFDKGKLQIVLAYLIKSIFQENIV